MWKNLMIFLSSIKKMHTKENWFFFLLYIVVLLWKFAVNDMSYGMLELHSISDVA